MRRRQFIESLGATTLLTRTAPAWGTGFTPEASHEPTPQTSEIPHESGLFYKPQGAWAADFIPFYDNCRFHLFYLHDWRDVAGHGEGTPWYQISTADFIHFQEHGQMLARGTKDEQDLYVFTGEPNPRGCGLMLRVNDTFDSAYFVRLEPQRNRLVFDSWPRPGDLPFWVEMERPIRLDPQQPIEMKVLVDGTVCVVYVVNKIAMSTRLYNLKEGSWGVFASEGSARFSNFRVSTR